MNTEFTEWISKLFSFNKYGEFYSDTIDEQYINKFAHAAGFEETNNVIGRISAIANVDYYFISCRWNTKGNGDNVLIIRFGHSNRFCIYKNSRDGKINYSFQYAKKIKIVIFDDCDIYYECKSGKLVPLSIKMLLRYKDNPYLYNFFQSYFSYLGQKHPIFKDILKWIQKDKKCFLPLKISDICQYHSLKEMFQANYKLANNINYSWNKRNINLSYMIIKSWNSVRPADRNKLLQITDWNFDNEYGFSIKNNIEVFLFEYIIDNIGVNESEYHIVRDYIKMCLGCKEKVNISFKSIKKINEAHDKLSEKNYISKTPVVKIAKESKFKLLRKLLPPEFEWIKTRKRLIHETAIQHHCVWSYADKINKDKCQIYSYVEDGERYTLEFVIRKKKYVCVQIRGLANSEPPEKIWTLVREILKNQ